MILSDSELSKLRKSGAKILSNGKPLVRHIEKTEVQCLIEVVKALKDLLEKPVEKAAPPIVNVTTPEVAVSVEPEQRPSKWQFKLNRDSDGLLEEIIATAID